MAVRRLIGSGSRFEAEIGHSRAVVGGDRVFVSGTTDFDYAVVTIADAAAARCGRALDNIESALAEAGFDLGEAVRVRYILPAGRISSSAGRRSGRGSATSARPPP